MSRVAVVIVTYNGERFLENALSALTNQSFRPHDVIVIDNASRDGTVGAIRQWYPSADVVQSTENVGFGRGCNVGIRRAFERGADLVLLLNQDTILEASALATMVDVMLAHPDCGYLSAMQFDYEGSAIDPVFKGFLPKEFVSDASAEKVRDVYWTRFMPAATVLLRREALERVGAFDPLFFLYLEDDDLCRRMGAGGWRIGLAPGATVRHWHGITHAKKSWQWTRNWEFSRAIFSLKWSRLPMWLAFARLFAACFVTRTWRESTPARSAARLLAISRTLALASTIARRRRQSPLVAEW